MTKADVLNGAKGKPVAFEFDGFACLLRPLTYGERRELFEWHAANEGNPRAGLELQTKFLLAAVCDAGGKPLLEAADLDGFAGPIADATAKEIARRNGLDGRAAGEPGKGESPTTTN